MPELPPPPVADPPAAPWRAVRPWWEAQRARAGPLAGAAGAVGALAALAVLGAVAWSAFLRPSVPPPELTLPRVGTPGDPGAVGDGTGADPGGAPRRDGSVRGDGDVGTVVAHVAGAVARPGVYRLVAGARLADAVDAAGGPTAEADVDAVNLAAKVGDGERVYVPRRGEVPPGAPGGAGSGGAGGAAAGPLDLNVATAAELEELPGVGPATAAAIVAYRQEHGRFTSVDELLEVRGIGEAKLAVIRSKVRVR